MIIVLLPGFAGNLKGSPRQKPGTPKTVSPDAGAVGEGDMEREPAPFTLPPSEPIPALAWSVDESNLVYCAAIRVASAIFKAHDQTGDTTGIVDTSMRVLAHAREVARSKGLDHLQMIAGLSDVQQVIGQTIVEQWGDYAEGWWKAEAAQAGRLLWLATSVYAATQEVREQLAKIYGAPHAGKGLKQVSSAVAEFMEEYEQEAAGLGPVNIVGDHVVVSIRPEGPEWPVPLADIPSPSKLLKYVQDLTGKTWCTRDLVHKFVAAVCASKGWEIYDLSPEHSQA